MKKVVLCHGFPYQKSFFSGLEIALKELLKGLNISEQSQFEIVNLDLGYFGNKNIPDLSSLNGAIAVGHGIGFNKLLDMNVSWGGIVGISTLLKFVNDDISKRKIESLENSFEVDRELALKSMVGRLTNNQIFFALPYSQANWDLIKQDINYLKNINSSFELKKKNIPTLFLNGAKDLWYDINDANKQLNKYNLIVNEDANHMLGYLDIIWCEKNIIKFIESI
jgi:hypothetical protein